MNESIVYATCSLSQLRCYDVSVSPERPICLNATDFNCEWYKNCYDCPILNADPDIAGKGVIGAFIATAGLTLILTMVFLLFRPKSDFPTLNPINRSLRLWISKWSYDEKRTKSSQIWAEALFGIVIQLSDQQLVTGTAMLVAIIYLRNQGTLSGYHYTMATDLVWFSSNTHLLSLLILRGQLAEERKLEERAEKFEGNQKRRSRGRSMLSEFRSVWRAMFMLVMAVLLMYANILMSYKGWYNHFDCPANCVPSRPIGGEPKRWLIVNLVLILYSYSLALIGLFRFTRGTWLNARNSIMKWDESFTSKGADSPTNKIYPTFRFMFLAIWYFLASEIFDILFQIAWFILGVRWTIEDRNRGHELMLKQERETEDTLGFGQLVPILLLVLPAMSLLEACYYSWKEIGTQVEDPITLQPQSPSK